MKSGITCIVTFLGLFLYLFSGLLPLEDTRALEEQLTGAAGKDRIAILSELSDAFQDKEPKKSLAYRKEALELLHLYPDAKQEITLLNGLSQTSIVLGDFTAAESYAQKSLAASQYNKDKIGEADATFYLGRTYMSQGRFQDAKDCYNKVLDIYRQRGDKNGIANSYQLISNIYFKIGDFSVAQEYAYKALDMFETLGNKKGIADVKNLSGIISSASGDYQEGLSCLKDANRRFEELGDKAGVARSLNNIGFTYTTMGQPSTSLEYYKKSLEISMETGSKDLLATVLSSIGETYALMEDYRQALTYFNRVLDIVRILDDANGMSYNLLQIGKARRKLGQYREARQALEQALDIANKINIKNEIKSANKELSELYETLGDHQKAVRYYKKFMDADEAVFNEKNRKKLMEIQIRYEPERNEKELILLKKDQQLQQLEMAQQENIRLAFLTVILLVLFLALGLYRGYRLKTKAAQGLSEEIHEHKQTAAKLRESEGKFRTLAEKSMAGVCIIQDELIRYANPAFLSIFGYTLDELTDQPFLKLIPEPDHVRVNSRGKNSTGVEFRGLTKEGSKPYLQGFRAFTHYRGQAAVLETVIDITERKKGETELQKMRKLEAVGALAGSIAGDFYRIFSSISTDVGQLKQNLQGVPGLDKLVENLERTSSKGTELAQKLSTFSEGGGAAFRDISLTSILNSTFKTYPQLRQMDCRISPAADLNPIYGDEGELSQVIGSLLWNALEAKTDGKNIEVAITAKTVALLSGDNVPLKPGTYIEISVADNGKGIPSGQLDNVFDPYFSTKETYHQKGMGLGLAICYSIIKKHNGHISINSQTGEGTTVRLLLPAVKEGTEGTANHA